MREHDRKRLLPEDVPVEQSFKRPRTPITAQNPRAAATRPISDGDIVAEPSNQEQALGQSLSLQQLLRFDTCFGVLEMETEYANASCADKSRVTIQTSATGSTLTLRVEENGISAGRLSSAGILRLLKEYDVTLTGTLLPIDGQSARRLKKNNTRQQWVGRSVRIIVYGWFRDKEALAQLLSDYELFLQNPSLGEFDSRVRFWNPHYFVRPGGSMPALNDQFTADSNMSAPTELSEGEKCEILRLFDSTAEEANDCKSPLMQSPRLLTILKGHQLQALRMMVEKEQRAGPTTAFPSLWAEQFDGRGIIYHHKITGQRQGEAPILGGGVLADEMGLGKTLSALSLICHHLDMLDSSASSSNRSSTKSPWATLIIAPKSAIYEWQLQINRHIRSGAVDLHTHHGSNRMEAMNELETANVVLTTYETLRSEFLKCQSRPLFEHRWARIILDEAHRIRNQSSKTFHAACAIHAKNRWCLTGTPIHNSVSDFGALMAFIRVPPFTSKQAFHRWIELPITSQGVAYFHPLRCLISATCLRRIKAAHMETLDLPLKCEMLEYIELDSQEREVYTFFQRRSFLLAEEVVPRPTHCRDSSYGISTLQLIGNLRLICNHAQGLLTKEALNAWKKRDVSLQSWGDLGARVGQCDLCGLWSELDDTLDVLKFVCKHKLCNDCVTLALNDAGSPTAALCPICSASLCSTPTNQKPHCPSTKIQSLIRNISNSRNQNGDAPLKCVVFSYWTKMLDIIQSNLLSNGIKFRRVDGGCTMIERSTALDSFNSDNTVTVMLASISAIAEGVNLTAASVVHIMEPQWNPMIEEQAIDRVHRIGQLRNVGVYRYIVRNSIESYVQAVQTRKLALIRSSLSSISDHADLKNMKQKELLEYLDPDVVKP